MAKLIQEISVFFPAYNEEENLEKTVLDARKVLQKVAERWEIIIVNDGSKDDTLKVAQGLKGKDGKIRIVDHKANKGYGGALKSGFKAAKYKWVAFADSDGQFKFSEITKLIEKIDEADLVLGYRISRADSVFRKLFTFAWALFPRIILGMKVKDYSCGFKLIKKKVFNDIQPLVGEEKVTQIEMLVKAQRMGFKFAEVGVHHYPRKHGSQTGANIKVVLKSISDLIELWKKLR